MIRNMDILMTDRGQIALIVPGAIPSGALTVRLQVGKVSLLAGSQVCVMVDQVAENVLDALARQADVALLAVPDAAHPPTTPTHQARIIDARASTNNA